MCVAYRNSLRGNDEVYERHSCLKVLTVGLMSILGLIVYDEFKMANEHGGELDENIIGLLQMSMTGVIGVVGGYIGGKSNG